MVAETIFVGTEILLGNIVNSNAAYLGNRLAALGINSYYQTVVGDNRERMEHVIRTALSRADIVILSGGLGPTQDDLTKEVAADIWNRKLYLHEESLNRIKAYFEKRNRVMSENNKKQAMIPEGANVLVNHNGTAPGILMEEAGKTVILLPGPPLELEMMFEESVVPYLQQFSDSVIASVTVKVCGRSESEIAQILSDLIERDKKENKEGVSDSGDNDKSGEEENRVTVAPYAKSGEVHLRVTASAKTEDAAKRITEPVVKEIKSRLGDSVYSDEEQETLEDVLVKLLKKNGLMITTAESCTGGLVGARLVNVAGASDVLGAAFITYSNEAKGKQLGVRKETLQRYGAVSEETVREMALGAARSSGAKVAIATSGIAGPGGGTEEKPVGLVYIACAVYDEVKVLRCQFCGNRQKVRESAVTEALVLTRDCILKYEKGKK